MAVTHGVEFPNVRPYVAGEVGNAPLLLQHAVQLRGEADAEAVYWIGRADEAQGEPADTLIQVAEAADIDLIVVGNKGMQRRVLGSVPNAVTHKAGCSVLVAPSPMERYVTSSAWKSDSRPSMAETRS